MCYISVHVSELGAFSGHSSSSDSQNLHIALTAACAQFKGNVDNGAETHVTRPYACPVTCQSVDIHHILSSCGKSSLR